MYHEPRTGGSPSLLPCLRNLFVKHVHTLCGPKCCSSSNSVKSNGRFPTKAVYGGWVGRGTSSRGGYLLASPRSDLLQKKTSCEHSGGKGSRSACTHLEHAKARSLGNHRLPWEQLQEARLSVKIGTFRWRWSTHGRLGSGPSRLPTIHSLNGVSDNQNQFLKT
jgi:hypothetical protein